MKRAFIVLAVVWAVAVHAAALPPQGAVAGLGTCPRCGWMPPAAKRTVTVRTIAQLQDAVAGASSGTTILVERGDYRLGRTLELSTPGVVLRGATGNAADVTLHGEGMAEPEVGVAIAIGASNVTVADVTIRDVRFHGIQVRGEAGASDGMIHNVHVIDTGQQLLKGSTAGGPRYSDRMTVACSTFEYTDSAPSDYTNGIDVLGGRDWVVRDNRLVRIHGPATARFASGPAILFWANSIGTVIERNVVIDSFRGIAAGLGPNATPLARSGERRYDHQGGAIRNNVVVNLHAWADEGIEANAASALAIDHNTVITSGQLSWAISVRFPSTSAWVRNNLTTKPILQRDGGQSASAGNISGAAADWFVDAAGGNAALTGEHREPIDAGIVIPEIIKDFRGAPRVGGRAPDAGAVEYDAR